MNRLANEVDYQVMMSLPVLLYASKTGRVSNSKVDCQYYQAMLYCDRP